MKLKYNKCRLRVLPCLISVKRNRKILGQRLENGSRFFLNPYKKKLFLRSYIVRFFKKVVSRKKIYTNILKGVRK